jgi:hypothetical protein
VPTSGPGSAHSGSKLWATNLAGNVPMGTDSYLTSPAIPIPTIGANEIVRVRFYGWIEIDEMYDRGEFQVSSNGINWVTKSEFFHKMQGGWTEYYFDVSDYAGGNIYLRFRLYADTQDAFWITKGTAPPYASVNMAGWYIDDVAIVKTDTPAIQTKLTLEAWENQFSLASCPWVYTWDGSNYVKDNDVYSTARGAGAEYTDFYKLNKPLEATNDKYLLQLKETESESSWTDLVQLKTVDHASNVKISNDENGNILTYSNPSAPVTAVDKNGNSVLSQISIEDNAGTKVYQNDYVDLDFSSYDTSNGATLVMKVLGFQADGDIGVPTNEKPYIYIQTQDSGGNWVNRNIFYPRSDWTTNAYDLKPYLVDSKLVRLYVKSCNAGKYHIIDYIGLDLSPQASTTVNILLPVKAVSSINGEVTEKLSISDNDYASMAPSESISLEFSASPVSDETRDFIFVSEGYYLPMGTFFIYTWDGTGWAQRDAWTVRSNTDQTKNFDLSMWLPDPAGEYKVRIWQDYWYNDARIDFVGLTRDSIPGTIDTATDLRQTANRVGIGPVPWDPALVKSRISASDNTYLLYGQEWPDSYYYGTSGYIQRDRWLEVKWTGLNVNNPPTTYPVTISNPESSTPTIGWTYADADSDPQTQYEVQVWTGAGKTGTNIWNPGVGIGSVSLVYAGTALVEGQTYYARVAAFDGTNWGGWSESSWTYSEAQQPQCSDGLDNDGDGKIDYPDDPGCTNANDNDERDSSDIPEFPTVALPVLSIIGLMFLFLNRKK